MATTDRTSATAADALAERLRAASFAHLLVRADGECLAAAGSLAAACAATDRPYQVSVVRTRAAAEARVEALDERATLVAVGVDGLDRDGRDGAPDAPPLPDGLGDRPSLTAFGAADALDAEPGPALALAGVVAGGATPEDAATDVLERTAFERRPGVVAPTADRADALAHTTLAHVAYSGDVEAAGAVVSDVAGDDADDPEAAARRVASVLAIDAVTAEGATDRAAHAIERAIHPLVGGPLETVGGYADVLGALAATAPGLGVALALGCDADAALDTWRDHAAAAHAGVRSAEPAHHDGLLVARTDGPVEAVARLLRDYRSPEPAVLALGAPAGHAGRGTDDAAADGRAGAALATVDGPADAIAMAAEAVGGSGLARGTLGYAAFDAADESAFLDAVEEAI